MHVRTCDIVQFRTVCVYFVCTVAYEIAFERKSRKSKGETNPPRYVETGLRALFTHCFVLSFQTCVYFALLCFPVTFCIHYICLVSYRMVSNDMYQPSCCNTGGTKAPPTRPPEGDTSSSSSGPGVKTVRGTPRSSAGPPRPATPPWWLGPSRTAPRELATASTRYRSCIRI